MGSSDGLEDVPGGAWREDGNEYTRIHRGVVRSGGDVDPESFRVPGGLKFSVGGRVVW